MRELVYNFFDFSTVYPSALLLCLAVGSYFLWFAIHTLGNAQVEYNNKPILVKNLPLLGRILAQGLPFLLGAGLILYGSINLFNIAKFHTDYHLQNYCEIEGPISVSQIERSDGRDRELYSVVFSIGDVEFDTANAYAPEEKIWFVEGQEMYVEYGFIGQQLMIYKIYAIDGYDDTNAQ